VEKYKDSSAAEAVEGAALSLESVDDIHSRNGLPAGVLRVGDGISDDVFEERLKNLARVVIDEGRDTLDTASARKSADRRLRDALRSRLSPVLRCVALARLTGNFTSLAFASSGHFMVNW
jgi:hypothetical protein